MRCAWEEYVRILPLWLRQSVDKHYKNSLQEIRLRLDAPPELITHAETVWLQHKVTQEDMAFVVNAASRYSPWAAATISEGYITAPGGHRVGICGKATVSAGNTTNLTEPSSVCLRVARDFPGIAARLRTIPGSVLIIGKPGWGKTTLLRDLIRQRSDYGNGSVCVIDEKGELFPCVGGRFSYEPGRRTDVLTGCPKSNGIDAVLRNMGPSVIAVDEITASSDCQALYHAGWCGVDLLATAHAGDKEDFLSRPVYHTLTTSRLFETLVVLRADKSWQIERMNECI